MDKMIGGINESHPHDGKRSPISNRCNGTCISQPAPNTAFHNRDLIRTQRSADAQPNPEQLIPSLCVPVQTCERRTVFFVQKFSNLVFLLH
jgi:hypothetical protein